MRKMTTNSLTRAVAALGVAVVAAACQDLEVENLNDPDRELALDREDDVELLGQKAWVPYYDRTSRQGNPNRLIQSMTREATTTVGNNQAWPLGAAEPRERIHNDAVSEDHTPIRWLWYGLYEGYSNANEVLWAIHDRDPGMVFEDDEGEDYTHMVEAWAFFNRGLTLGKIGKTFDRAYIVDFDDDMEDMATFELEPWQNVVDFAYENHQQVIELTEQHDFVLPGHVPGEGESGGYMFERDVTSDMLNRYAHTHSAFLLAYSPRSPDQLDQVDWNQVLHHAERGLQVDSFAARTGSDYLGRSNYRMRLSGSGSWMGISYWTLGFSDIAGNFQDWLSAGVHDKRRFVLESADARIHPPGNPEPSFSDKNFSKKIRESEDETIQYFRYHTSLDIGSSWRVRGEYLGTFYPYFRGYDIWQEEGWNWGGRWDRHVPLWTPYELDLLRAEAYLHLGQTGPALEIINDFRWRGSLPPIEDPNAPVPHSEPGADDCVPRTLSGECGDIWDALFYEKDIELMALRSQRAWYDQRRSGTLLCGTVEHFPVPARELQAAPIQELYTFGGAGREEGTASAPDCIDPVDPLSGPDVGPGGS